MLEQEPSIEIPFTKLELSTPLSEDNIFKYDMNSVERNFSLLLLSKGLEVYREPYIHNCKHIPDFWVYNPFRNMGKLVEITLLSKEEFLSGNRRTVLRKRRQYEELSNIGIPYIVLYRENMESIRRGCYPSMF